MKNQILELKSINKSFLRDDGSSITILDDINIKFGEGEIIGIIGRSGCGKSTLLRLITGLIPITSGKILFYNKPIDLEIAKISMVFQTFGLFPWLTVFENIALGLRAKGVTEQTIKSKVSMAIELVGLTGFEEAFPREISGGMRQRVGFARAIVMDPEILILDEPFSALDFLTANILRSDLLDLWFERNISSIKSIIMVTHSIEEALALCDRVIVLSSNPGKVIANIEINIAHPRDSDSKEFSDNLELIYSSITKKNKELELHHPEVNAHSRYPQSCSIITMIGFLEHIKQDGGHAEISVLVEKLELSYNTVASIIESLLLLKFIDVDGNKISITSAGNILLDADDEAKKQIIKEHLVKYVNYIKSIYHQLKTVADKPLTRDALAKLLNDKFSDTESENIINYTINWARYAELFIYDAKSSTITLSK